MHSTTNYLKHASQNPIQQFLIENFYRSLRGLASSIKPNKILDVGCGEGTTIVKLKQAKIGKTLEGIDNSEDALRIGKGLYQGISIKSGDIYNLPYRDKSFDLLICTEVLEHLKNPRKALAELRRVSNKYVLLSVPNEPFFIMANLLRGKYLRNRGNHPEHINHWTNPGFKVFLRRNGFRIAASRSPFPWTLILARK